ncbi:50S ribosomal protein L18 [Athalassotoga saccharophila]|uniref:50S ribosomal protein L18 n=1 Tax=Athalassotoga saccharophila TaxID=1441386 RepID=UPI00137ADC86|nr:50S ribosomal protein L18 [Athalassotoga saccharophila]BBJ27216.1 50S ribosomal protein L18 [Athalassotoga saccharophila]
MIQPFDRKAKRIKRHLAIRRRIHGTHDVPRLSVFVSDKHAYAQIIDDDSAKTLVSASTLQKSLREALKNKTWNKAAARLVGKEIGARAIEAGIKEVVFDRSGFRYHGRIKEIADGARESGLKF